LAQYPQNCLVVDRGIKVPQIGALEASIHRAKKLLARVHERISNARQDFLHKLSRKIINDNQVVVVENLNVKGMVRIISLVRGAKRKSGTVIEIEQNILNRFGVSAMLRKKYHIEREFSTSRQLSGKMDEQMALIDRMLCDDKLFKLIETDLSKRYLLSTQTGRKSTPVEVILRLLVDAVKVISRILSQAKKLILFKVQINLRIFRNRNRTARRISREIDRLSTT